MTDDGLSITVLECGRLYAEGGLFIEGESGRTPMTVYAFLIRHPKGLVLFDAGMLPKFDGRRLLGEFDCEVPEGHDVASRLRALDVDPDAIPRVVLSHSHFDHAAGVPLLPNADLLVHRAEHDWVMNDEFRVRDRMSLQHGHRITLTYESLDLFGDGSVELFATPGHTCGHQSLRVRCGERWDVLAGDACYFCRSLEPGAAPQSDPWRADLYEATLERLRDMRRAGDFVVPGHDEAFLTQIPADSRIRALT